MSRELRPGDVLSFSAGTTDADPRRFRVLRRKGDLLGSAAARWPWVFEPLRGRLPLLINAYPAPVRFESGVLIDTYLSVRSARRALTLAALEGMPVLLCGQPLLLGEILLRHREQGGPWPGGMLLITGGYPMPRSLEQSLRAWARTEAPPPVLHLYGAAEVDAGCLAAAERNAGGELIYFPRGPEIGLDLDPDGQLLLSLLDDDPRCAVSRFPTGDRARREGDGWLLSNPHRYASGTLRMLEGWSPERWARCTGFSFRTPDGALRWQLRERAPFEAQDELEFHDFARVSGLSWLSKPRWADL